MKPMESAVPAEHHCIVSCYTGTKICEGQSKKDIQLHRYAFKVPYYIQQDSETERCLK